MAVTLLGSKFDTSTGTHNTGSLTPAVGDLIVIVVANSGYTGTTAPTDDNADGLGTYTLVETQTTNTSADTLQVYIRDALIGSATATIFSHAGASSTGGGLAVVKVTGMTRFGSAAKKRSGGQSNQASATPAPAWTGGGSASGTNPLVGAILNKTNPATMTKPATFDSELLDVGYSTPNTGLEVVSDDTGNTDSTVTWGSSSASEFASAILELDASTGASESFMDDRRRRRSRRVLQRMV